MVENPYYDIIKKRIFDKYEVDLAGRLYWEDQNGNRWRPFEFKNDRIKFETMETVIERQLRRKG